MKLSLIIPFYPIDETKYGYLHTMLDSCNGYDEVLLIENQRAGFATAINFGFSQATGDYLLMSSDDVVWDGNIRDLCVPDMVTVPMINGYDNRFSGVTFCIPRTVYEKVGGLSEEYDTGYFEDDDYYRALFNHNIPM